MVSQQNAVHAHLHNVTSQTYTHVMLEASNFHKTTDAKTMYGKCITITWNHETKNVTQKQIDTKKVENTQNPVKKTGNKTKKK